MNTVELHLPWTPMSPYNLLLETLHTNDIWKLYVSMLIYPFLPFLVHPRNPWCLEFTLNSSIKISSTFFSLIKTWIKAPSKNILLASGLWTGIGLFSNILYEHFKSVPSHREMVVLCTREKSVKWVTNFCFIEVIISTSFEFSEIRRSIKSLWSSLSFLLFLHLSKIFSLLCVFKMSLNHSENLRQLLMSDSKLWSKRLGAPALV